MHIYIRNTPKGWQYQIRTTNGTIEETGHSTTRTREQAIETAQIAINKRLKDNSTWKYVKTL